MSESTAVEETFDEMQERLMQETEDFLDDSYAWHVIEQRKIQRIKKQHKLKKIQESRYRSPSDIERRKRRRLREQAERDAENKRKKEFYATPQGKAFLKQRAKNNRIYKKMLQKNQEEQYFHKQIQYINECRMYRQPIEFKKRFGHEPSHEVRIAANYEVDNSNSSSSTTASI